MSGRTVKPRASSPLARRRSARGRRTRRPIGRIACAGAVSLAGCPQFVTPEGRVICGTPPPTAPALCTHELSLQYVRPGLVVGWTPCSALASRLSCSCIQCGPSPPPKKSHKAADCGAQCGSALRCTSSFPLSHPSWLATNPICPVRAA